MVLVGTFLLILYKLDKKVFRRFGLAVIGVLIFEYFTQALWINADLEPWSYLYLGVNWIITIGWAGIITVSTQLIKLYLPKYSKKIRYVISVFVVGIIGFFAEWVGVGLGVRQYTEAALEVTSGILIGYGKVPIEALYYIPVFMALVIAFVHYWEDILDKEESSKKGETK